MQTKPLLSWSRFDNQNTTVKKLSGLLTRHDGLVGKKGKIRRVSSNKTF